MIVSLSDPIYSAALYFGVLSLGLLWAFASLIFEVEQSLKVVKEFKDEEAQSVLWATANINLLAMLAAFATIGYCCVQIGEFGTQWQRFFVAASLATGLYWAYARSCEQRLFVFLKQVKPQPFPPKKEPKS